MFRHILVPVNFSEGNQEALRIAADIASIGEGRVSLLHVIEIISDTTFEEFQDFYMELEKRAHSKMEALMAPLKNSQMVFEQHIVYGNRPQEILQFADEHDVDLIVMSSHRVDLDEATPGWGTISYKVGMLSSCPIMLVK